MGLNGGFFKGDVGIVTENACPVKASFGFTKEVGLLSCMR